MRTKMNFIEYLLEEDRKIYATRRTPEEIQSLPVLNANSLEEAARVGKVVFDQKEGLGAVPNNQNVVYRGFVGMMFPKDFMYFAHRADREEDAKNILNLIEQGYGIGSPFLYLDIEGENPNLTMRIVGHEGRARCVALNYLQPNVAIPVHFFLGGGLRARSLTDQMIGMLNQRIKAEGSEIPVQGRIQSIWLRGENIPL